MKIGKINKTKFRATHNLKSKSRVEFPSLANGRRQFADLLQKVAEPEHNKAEDRYLKCTHWGKKLTPSPWGGIRLMHTG
jgi:hypothetical protein